MNQNCEHIYKLNPLVEQSIRISKITKYGQFHLRLRPSWILFVFCLLQNRERALMIQNFRLWKFMQKSINFWKQKEKRQSKWTPHFGKRFLLSHSIFYWSSFTISCICILDKFSILQKTLMNHDVFTHPLITSISFFWNFTFLSVWENNRCNRVN